MNEYKSKNFKVIIGGGKNKVTLTQEVFNKSHRTDSLSETVKILENKIPSIFECDCFNSSGNCFKKESASTEVGHLLEHIIIENLKLMTLKKESYASFSGETSWNWNEKKEGTFDIKIWSKKIDEEMFNEACRRSFALMEEIFDSSTI